MRGKRAGKKNVSGKCEGRDFLHIDLVHDEVIKPLGGARVYHLGISDSSPSTGMARAAEKAQSEAGPGMGKQSRAAAGL